MLKINSIKPVFNKIVTSCNTYNTDRVEGGIIVQTKGTVKEYQTVEAVGSTVTNIKVGDIIMINPTRYIRQHHKDKKDESLRGVIKDEVAYEVSFPTVEYGGKKHLLIYDADVDYIINGEEVEEEQPKSPLILPKEKKVIV